jgi:hypothetical protein
MSTTTQISGSLCTKPIATTANLAELRYWFMQFKKQCHGFFKVRLVNDEYVAYQCKNASDAVDGTIDRILASLMLDTPALALPPVKPPTASKAPIAAEILEARANQPKMWGK